jgi:peptide/nickel transport system substrate-binding protein
MRTMVRTMAILVSALVFLMVFAGTVAAASPGNPIVLTIGSNARVLSSLDRFKSLGTAGDDTGRLWGDPLASTDHRGTYTPALASSWAVSKDYLSYTFKLKKGIKFSNGDEFTSADVKKTFQRLIEDKTLIDAASWQILDRVDTPDPYTAVIVLKKAMPTFFDELDRVPVISAKAYEANAADYFMSPIGTGAFVVTSFNKQTGESRYTRNDNYWGWTADNQSNVDEIVYKFITEDTTRVSALQSGGVDVATMLPIDYLAKLDASKYTSLQVPMDTHFLIGFACGGGKTFGDKNLREAFSLSIDRAQIVEGIVGGGLVSTWPVPKDNVGYVAGSRYEYDPAKAKKLLAASGYKGEQLAMVLTSASFPRANEVATVVQAMAGAVGFNVKIEMLESATYESRRTSGNYDLYLGRFNSTCSDMQRDVTTNLLPDKFKSGAIDDKMRELCSAAAVTVDRAARTKLLEQIYAIEMNDLAPVIGLYCPVYLYPMQKNVTNVTVYADGTAVYKYVKIK